MKIGVAGIFGIKQWRKGKLIQEAKTKNSLTRRGVIELIYRMMDHRFSLVLNPDFGSIMNRNFFLQDLSLGLIDNAGFGGLDRDDRIQYYDANPGLTPDPTLGDNRDWTTPNIVGNVRWEPPFPGLTEPPAGIKTATSLSIFENWQFGDQEFIGLYIRHKRISEITNGQHFIDAVIASAVLPEPVKVQFNDRLEVSWTLTLAAP